MEAFMSVPVYEHAKTHTDIWGFGVLGYWCTRVHQVRQTCATRDLDPNLGVGLSHGSSGTGWDIYTDS